MKKIELLLLCVLSLVAMNCGGEDDGSAGSQLQSSCVSEQLELDRNIPDGGECSNFGYSDCGSEPKASECENYCAFDLCQAETCVSDSDCTQYGSSYTCESYTVSGTSYGTWCEYQDDSPGFQDPCDGCGGAFCSGDCIGCPQC